MVASGAPHGGPMAAPPPLPRRKDVTVVICTGDERERRGQNRGRTVCYGCGQRGHYRSECQTWKTRVCWHWKHDRCLARDGCSFAHGEHELRQPAALARAWGAGCPPCE